MKKVRRNIQLRNTEVFGFDNAQIDEVFATPVAAAPVEPEVLITLSGTGAKRGESVTGFKMPADIKNLPVPVRILFSPDFTAVFRLREGYKYSGPADFSIREAPIVLVDKADGNYYLATSDGYGLLYNDEVREKMVYQTMPSIAEEPYAEEGYGEEGYGDDGYGGGSGGAGGGFPGYDPFYPPYVPPVVVVNPPTPTGGGRITRPLTRPGQTVTMGGRNNNPTSNNGTTIPQDTRNSGGRITRPSITTSQTVSLPVGRVPSGGTRSTGRITRPMSTPRRMPSAVPRVGRGFDGSIDDAMFFDAHMTGESDAEFMYLGGRRKQARAMGLKGKALRDMAKKLRKSGWKKGDEVPEEILKKAPKTPQIEEKLRAAKKATLEKIKPALKDMKEASQQALAAARAAVSNTAEEVSGLSTPVKVGLAVGIPLILVGGFLLYRKFKAKQTV